MEIIQINNAPNKNIEHLYFIRLHRQGNIFNISTYDNDVFLIQVFLDQYGYLGKDPPVFSKEVINANQKWWSYKFDNGVQQAIQRYKSYDEVHQAMQIMLKPLHTYNDFIERIKEIEAWRQWNIIHPEMHPLGNINDWHWGDIYGELGGTTIQQLGDGEWQLISWCRGQPSPPS